MGKIDAVIFDLDGLLVDSEPVWFRVRAEMFQRFGLKWTNEDQKALMGRSTSAWIDYVDDKLQGRLSREEIVNETINGMVAQYRSGKVPLMPGAREALEYCAGIFVLGLASGSPNVLIDAALEANGWQRLFFHVVSSDAVRNGKPYPDVYVEIMRRLNVAPHSCLVIEDSESGILAGKAAGAYVIAVPNKDLVPAREVLIMADVVVDSLLSVPEAIRNIEITQRRAR